MYGELLFKSLPLLIILSKLLQINYLKYFYIDFVYIKNNVYAIIIINTHKL